MPAENEINFLNIFQMIPEHILVIETVFFINHISSFSLLCKKKKNSFQFFNNY